MAEEITLSIIIPNYNSGKLLEESLESIYNEDVSFSFEVLVMDNCSSDLPNKILEKFPFQNLYFYSEPDSGIYNAMNKGIKKVRGEWIYFLGAGDSFNFNEIKKIDFEYFLSQNVKLIYGNVFMVSKKIIYDGVFSLGKLLKKNICHQSILFNKVLFKKFGSFNEKFEIAADYDLNLKIFFDGKIKKSFVDLVFANYSGNGVSDRRRDHKFSNLKNNLILTYFIKNYNFELFVNVINYFLWLLKRKIYFEISNFPKN